MSDSEQHGDSRQLGKGMIAAAWIVALVLLTFVFNEMLEDQYNPNRQVEARVGPGGSAEVVLKRNRAGHYVASGHINGQAVTFLLDTGATDVAVPARLALRLKLARGSRQISRTANGDVVTWSTRIRQVELGGIRLDNVRASILPGMDGEEVLLGMSFLKRLQMIQFGDTLTLRQVSS